MRRVQTIDDRDFVKHAIISVSDKSGLDTFVPGLIEANPGIVIFSTGGTYKRIQEILSDQAPANLRDVAGYIGQPETEGGLVKTLDFKLFLGYLTETYSPAHQEDLRRTGSVPINVVAFNLYPFRDAVAKEGSDPEDARMNIDIGGPAALSAAAKNWHRVATVVNPQDYGGLVDEIKSNEGCTRVATRFELSKKVWQHLAEYRAAISEHMQGISIEQALAPYNVVPAPPGGK